MLYTGAYSFWRVNDYNQGFRSLASFGLGGPASAALRAGRQESASKPPQTIGNSFSH